MPSTVGYPVDSSLRSKKWEQERARVEELWSWAREVRRAEREHRWDRNERQYDGRHAALADGIETDSTSDNIVVNMSFSTVNTIVPYITGSEPSFYVEPYMAPANKRAATALKTWLNRTWRHHEVNGQEHLQIAAEDHLIYGDGWIEVMWEIEETEQPDGSILGTTTGERARVWVDRVSPWDVWLDPWSDSLANARFVAVRKSLPKSQIVSNKNYKNVKDLSSDTQWTEDDSGKLADGRLGALYSVDSRDEIVDIIEFYDITGKQLVVFIPGRNYPIRVVKGVRAPIFHLKSYRIPRLPYGMSELEQLWSLQLELNKTRSQMITHRRRNTAKYLARKGAFQQDGIDALTSEEVNAIVWIESNDPLESVLRPVEVAQMSADPYQVSDLITRDIYEISGVNEYLRGAAPSITRTATEATIIESASNVKSAYKLRQIEKFVRKIGQHMLDVASEVFPTTALDEFTMVLVGREAQALAAQNDEPNPSAVIEAQMELTEDTFQGEYQVFVETNSTEMRNPRFRAEQLKDTMMTLSQVVPLVMQLGQAPPNLLKVMELWLEAVGIDDLDAILAPAQQPGMGMMPPSGGMMPGENAMGSQPGMPELGNVGAPTAPLTAANTGAVQ